MALIFRVNTKVIYPTAVAIKTRHGCTHQLIIQQGNQKELRLDLSFGADISGGIVVWLSIWEDFLPEFDDIFLVSFAEWANVNFQ